MEKENEIDVKKRMFILFILFFPSILIALIPSYPYNTGVLQSLTPLIIKILLAGYQFVVIKNFVDTQYGG